MSGESDPQNKPDAKEKKKRQQVRRHYKPSLGRYVETYKRTGENAMKKVKKTGGREKDRPALEAEAVFTVIQAEAPPRRRRWPVYAALILVVALAAIAGFLVYRARTGPRHEIHRAHAPILVPVDVGGPDAIVSAGEGTRRRWVALTVEDVVEVLNKHPDRPVALSLGKVPLAYGELSAPQRQTFHVRLAGDPRERYETSLVALLSAILDGVEQARPEAALSVSGLPVEPRIISPSAAQRTNAAYRPIIARLDPLVSDHAYIMADTSLTEVQMASAAMPEGLRHRGRRPILFRTNGVWRVLLDHGALAKADPADPAGLYALVDAPAAGGAAVTPPPRGNVVLGAQPVPEGEPR